VLIVDLDPQGNASTGLGIDRKSREISTYDLLLGEATLLKPRSRRRCREFRWRRRRSISSASSSKSPVADRAFRLRKALFGDGEPAIRVGPETTPTS
jgi:chromosome partitioning protein